MSLPSSEQNESEGLDSKTFTNRQYKNFELVWAKVMGFPWWPGKIIGRHEKDIDKYAVIFCLEGTTELNDEPRAYLKSSKILPFVYGEKPPVNLKTASPDLLKAIKIFNTEYEKAIIFYSETKEKEIEADNHENEPIQIDSDSNEKVLNEEVQERSEFMNAPFEIIYHHRENNNFDGVAELDHKREKGARKRRSQKHELSISKWKKEFVESLVSKGYDRKDAVKTTSKFIKEHFDQLEKIKSLTKTELKQMKIEEIQRLFPN